MQEKILKAIGEGQLTAYQIVKQLFDPVQQITGELNAMVNSKCLHYDKSTGCYEKRC